MRNFKIWKKVKGYPLYEVSSMGEIKTFNWKGKGKTAIMKPAPDAAGYLRTMLLGEDGKFHTIKVHRIVAQTFIPNPENKPQVNHINGIKDDNRIENLEWNTVSENLTHSFRKLGRSIKGEKNPACRLTEAQAQEILDNYQFGKKHKHGGGKTKKQLAEQYGVTFYTIKNLVQRNTWKYLS